MAILVNANIFGQLDRVAKHSPCRKMFSQWLMGLNVVGQLERPVFIGLTQDLEKSQN